MTMATANKTRRTAVGIQGRSNRRYRPSQSRRRESWRIFRTRYAQPHEIGRAIKATMKAQKRANHTLKQAKAAGSIIYEKDLYCGGSNRNADY